MKRIAIFLMIAVMGTAAVAAVKKAPLSISSAPAAVSSAGSASTVRIGALTVSRPGGFASIPTYGMRTSPTMSWDVGLAVGQNAAGANTNLGILVRLENQLFKVGDLKVINGGNLFYATNPGYAAAATPSTTLNLFGGVEYEMVKNLTILGCMTLLEATSGGGVTQIGIGAGTAGNGTGLGTVSVAFYNGIRLYL